MKDLTIEEKIAEIKNTNSYQDVKNSWFPPYHEKEYYFVSYSHKDYKLVYESLHRLQSGEKRLNLWYDHNLTPGRDWEIEARRYIYDFNCKGVIFFLSEIAVLSQSIHKEIEFVKNSGKSYLSINLPCEKIEGHLGKCLPAAKMLELLKQQGHVIENYEEKSAVLTETFNDKVTFLPLNEDIDSQITKILSLKRQPLLNIDDGAVISINDINALEIKREDFDYLNKRNERETATKIGPCAFANCRYLKQIELPEEIGSIGSSCFYNCTDLNEILIPKQCSFIGSRAFYDCKNLKKVILKDNILQISNMAFYNCINLLNIFTPNSIEVIGDSAFYGCTNLLNILTPNGIESIGDFAFCICTNLSNVVLSRNLKRIGRCAFEYCKHLTNITIAEHISSSMTENRPKISLIDTEPAYIGDGAFAWCTELIKAGIPSEIESIGKDVFLYCINLQQISMSHKIKIIEEYALQGCKNLKDIFYDGTRQQWQEIKKDKNWDYGTPDYTVHCTDGDLKKGEF